MIETSYPAAVIGMWSMRVMSASALLGLPLPISAMSRTRFLRDVMNLAQTLHSANLFVIDDVLVSSLAVLSALLDLRSIIFKKN
jgi:hypothetical protein